MLSHHPSVARLCRGEGYGANDPELHRWTAATLFVAFVIVHETFIGKKELCWDHRIYATSLNMPEEMWPKSLEAFWEYWDACLRDLDEQVGEEARTRPCYMVVV